jgi:hypothetical protein
MKAAGRSRMFDLESDPGERLNVAGGNVERAREYERLLRGWSAAQKEVLLAAARPR